MALVVVASFNTKAQTIFCQIERTVNSLGDLLSYRVSPPPKYIFRQQKQYLAFLQVLF